MLTYVGVDLGQKGALAMYTDFLGYKREMVVLPFWDYHGGTALRTATEKELTEYIRELLKGSSELYVTIEHPAFIASNGRKSLAASFHNFGLMKGIFYGIDFTELWTPHPKAWQKTVGGSSNKTRNLTIARKAYPKTKNLTIETADAVLICEACRKAYG